MKKPHWLLLGADSLIGKDIRSLVEERKLPVALRLASSQSTEHILAASDDDEVDVLEPLTAELLAEAHVVFLGASAEVNRRALALAASLNPRPAFIDLDASLEDLPNSVLRAPLLEAAPPPHTPDSIHSLAHPAATALARLVTLLSQTGPLTQSVATILEPASQHGAAAIDELHQQAISLFNFKPAPSAVFDTQAAFNLLPRYGPESKLSSNSSQIERHLASLLGPSALPLPSFRIVHAPVFHAYSISLWAAFSSRPNLDALNSSGLDLRGPDTEPASNLAVAGVTGLVLSDVAPDPTHPNALWLWAAFDNLRAAAENALLTAATVSRERGALS